MDSTFRNIFLGNIPGGKWNKKAFWQIKSDFELPESFSTSSIAVLATASTYKDSWKQAGYLYQFIEIPLFGKADLNDTRLFVPLNKLVVLSNLVPIQPSYRLRFEMPDWINSLSLTILEPTMPLYPITSDPTPNPSASSAFVSTTVAITSSASVKVLSVNLARKAFSIYNPDKTNSICVDVVSTVTATSATFLVPPGQAYISDFDWTGEVYAITKSGNINATVREFS